MSTRHTRAHKCHLFLKSIVTDSERRAPLCPESSPRTARARLRPRKKMHEHAHPHLSSAEEAPGAPHPPPLSPPFNSNSAASFGVPPPTTAEAASESFNRTTTALLRTATSSPFGNGRVSSGRLKPPTRWRSRRQRLSLSDSVQHRSGQNKTGAGRSACQARHPGPG